MIRAVKLPHALARARALPSPKNPMDDPFIVRLTRRFVTLKVRMAGEFAAMAKELGEILLEGRARLKRLYPMWQDECLHVPQRTASDYVAIARFAAESPDAFAQCHDLGQAKICRLARISAAGRRLALRTPAIADMRYSEFKALTARYAQHRPCSGNVRVNALRQRLGSWARKLKDVRLPMMKDPEVRAGLRADLVELVTILSRLLNHVR